MVDVPPEYSAADRRRMRSAMFGRGALTRSDAELLAAQFPYNGSRASKLLMVSGPLGILYFGAIVVLGIAHHASVGRLVAPVLLVALCALALMQRLRVRRKIRRALATSSD